MPEHCELVLLLGDDGFLPVQLDTREPRVDQIVQRERSADGLIILRERLWVNTNDERALSGQRIFRELLAPAPSTPSENPLFDELILKKPLPFTWRDS